MEFYKFCRIPLWGLMGLLLFSGCTKQPQVDSPGLQPSGITSEDSSMEFSGTLTADEQKVFSSTGQLDKNLSSGEINRVRTHFVKYARDRRSTMEVFLRNSIPYLNYTKGEFRKRGLPEDLAYLAYLESGYNPLAVSSSKAVGMWQFISSTGKNYGLQQDWWVDERMDPYRSTEAAAQYLSRLYDIFHDWHLAVASYNGGEGKIGRAKQAAGADTLHELLQKNHTLNYETQLREETQLYVPRFLAISKIMRNPDILGLKPASPDADHPVLVPAVALTAKPATDLVELCRLLGMTWKEFLAYNPHFLRSITPINRTSTVYIPRNKEAQARKFLTGTISGAGWTYYTVRSRDTLAKISATTGVPASIISQINPGALKQGNRLRLPARRGSISPQIPSMSQNTAIAASSVKNDQVSAALAELEKDSLRKASASSRSSTSFSLYRVQSGDTLTNIAGKYGVSLDTLYALNGGRSNLETIRVGQNIRVPGSNQKVAVPPRPLVNTPPSAFPKKSQDIAEHTVQTGETASSIARQYGINFGELCAANGGIEKLNQLRPGMILKLPGSRSNTAVAASPKITERIPVTSSYTAKGAAEVYKVQSGETLWSISRKFNMPPTELLALNGMNRDTKVKVGDTVKVIRNK